MRVRPLLATTDAAVSTAGEEDSDVGHATDRQREDDGVNPLREIHRAAFFEAHHQATERDMGQTVHRSIFLAALQRVIERGRVAMLIASFTGRATLATSRGEQME